MSRKNTTDYHNGYRSSSICNTLLTTLKILAFIFLYWCCSISLTFFNRHLFRDYQFPLSITTLHMAIKFLFAALIRWFLHRFCFCSCCTIVCGQHQNNDRERVYLTWPILWRKVAPTGISSFMNICSKKVYFRCGCFT
jgi:solute carrier family 35 protein C2